MRIQAALVIMAVLLTSTESEGGEPEPGIDTTHRANLTATTRVPVLVYSAVPDLAADDQRIALETAEEALSTASVHVDWTLCTPGACLTPSPSALRIRIAVSPDALRRDRRILGQAFVDPQTRTGVLATVFIDRTRRLAGELSIDHRLLLGRAIAHELGHLLMATATHGAAGLMREQWSRDELLGTRRANWIFDPLDAAAIRERLTSRIARNREPGTPNRKPTTNH